MVKHLVCEGRGKIDKGKAGEAIALDFLKRKGYRILETNFRPGKLGEIDIIAREGEYICFVEVKTRSSVFFGYPSESVNRKKQLNMIRAAQVYLKQNGLNEEFVRFDIVEVLIDKEKNDSAVEINLIGDAFRRL